MPSTPRDGRRGSGSADGSGDGPDYGWLYGGAPSDDEQTRILPRRDPQGARGAPARPTDPTSRRTGDQGGSSDRPGRSARPAPTPRPAPAPRSRRRGSGGRARRGRRIVFTLLALWLVFLIAVPLWAWSKITKVDADPSAERPGGQRGTTYLLVGSDSRKGLSKKENQRLGTGGVGEVGQRTDTIMVLHTGRGPSLLLSIPRDSIVPVPGHGTTKINSAFAYGGPELLVETVEQSTGLRIDHYVEIGFGGFVNAVDAVGGVTICPKKAMKDPKANLNIKGGCQEADGVTALGYSRSRYTSGLGDVDRARRQREVVSAIGAEVKSPWTVLNPFRYYRVADAGTSSLKVSKGSGPIALANFAFAMTRVNGESGMTCSMPIRDLAVHWDREKALALLKYVKEDKVGDIPKSLCLSAGMKE